MVLAAFDLAGRVALVTGGSKGIGRALALALALAEAGADVAVVSRHLAECQAVAEAVRGLGRRGLALEVDVTRQADAERAVAETVRVLGRLDVLVNNAGTNCVKDALEVTESDWDHVMDTNLKAVFFWSQAAARAMVGQGGGKIINISSVGGVIGESKMAAYAASKAGVISITKSLAREWGRHNIQVNCIAPGFILTDLNREMWQSPALKQWLAGVQANPRMGTPEDLGPAAVFLAGPGSDYITGQVIAVDGGYSTTAVWPFEPAS